MASLVAEHGLSCLGMSDLPGPGTEPMSPAPAHGFLTSGSPGKSFGTFSNGTDL